MSSLLFSCALLIGSLPVASAQSKTTDLDYSSESTSRQDDLPDAPSAVSVDEPTQARSSGPARTAKHRTGVYDPLIDTNEIAPRLTAFDKVGMGIKASISPFAVLGWIGSSTYGEAFNRSPNYGQDPKNYLQRFGASAARASSETIFTTSILAPILREDPRYYVLGPGHGGFRRTTYSLGRIFVTRTDSGGRSFNYALFGGNLAGSALTQAYYPPVNRGFTEVLTTFGTSLGGAAVKNLFDEFLAGAARVIQLEHKLPL